MPSQKLYWQIVKMPESYFYRGEIKFQLKDYQGASDDFTNAITNKQDYADAYNDRASCKTELKDYKGAIDDYNKSIAINKNAYTYNNLGSAQRKAGNNDDAIASYSVASCVEIGLF